MLHIFIQFIRTYSDSEGILEHVVSLIADVSSGESDHISTLSTIHNHHLWDVLFVFSSHRCWAFFNCLNWENTVVGWSTLAMTGPCVRSSALVESAASTALLLRWSSQQQSRANIWSPLTSFPTPVIRKYFHEELENNVLNQKSQKKRREKKKRQLYCLCWFLLIFAEFLPEPPTTTVFAYSALSAITLDYCILLWN